MKISFEKPDYDSSFAPMIQIEGENYYVRTALDKDAPKEAFDLIAAAPDLLEAIKYCRKRIEDIDAWWIDSPDKGGFDIDLIDAAIAKSEGK